MRNIYSPLNILLMIILLSSCGKWLLPHMELITISTDENIKMTFSTQPSEESVKKAFSMTEDDISITGYFTFYDTTAVFEPLNGLRNNREYQIVVTTTAEDTKGNSLLRDFEYKFNTKQNIELPRVTGIIPANESNLTTQPDKISISFSKPVDTVTFEKALYISPAINYILRWDSTNTAVDIIPLKPLAEGIRYNLTLNTSLMDTSRNTLLTAFTSTFLYGLDRNSPEISIKWESPYGASGPVFSGVRNTNIPSDSDLIIEFDKRVSIDAISSFIEINPAISFTTNPDLITKDKMRLKFNQIPEWGKSYTLKVKKGISDTFGNKTETENQYVLVFNAEKFRPPAFAGGVLNNNSDYKLINPSSDYSSLTLDVIYFDPGSHVEKSTELYYAFRISTEADSISLISAMQTISISTGNSCAFISIRTMNFLTKSDSEYNTISDILDDNSDGKLCILKIGIDIENTDNRGFIGFSIRKDIADNLGNTMIETLNFTLNKQ